MSLWPNVTEKMLNEQHDVYEKAREEYRKKIAEQAAEIERLRAENASLSSWQCEFTDGKTGLVYGAGGSTYCAMAKEVERLRAALRKIADNKQVRGDCFCGACLQARHARAALEGK